MIDEVLKQHEKTIKKLQDEIDNLNKILGDKEYKTIKLNAQLSKANCQVETLYNVIRIFAPTKSITLPDNFKIT